jgi:hypothetical protein
VVIEGLEDVREPLELGFRLMTAGRSWHRSDLSVLVAEG